MAKKEEITEKETSVVRDIIASLDETPKLSLEIMQVLEIKKSIDTGTEIELDEQLLIEYLTIYKKHLPVLVPLIKSIVAVCKAIYNDAEELANRWQTIIAERIAKKKKLNALKRMEKQLENL